MKSKMHNPPHPGKVLKELYIDELELKIVDVAKALDVSRQNLSMIVNGHVGISPGMALRLGKAFKTEPEMWVNMQKNYDMWHARRASSKILSKVKAVA
jgi:addiction module HigA family antidote